MHPWPPRAPSPTRGSPGCGPHRGARAPSGAAALPGPGADAFRHVAEATGTTTRCGGTRRTRRVPRGRGDRPAAAGGRRLAGRRGRGHRGGAEHRAHAGRPAARGARLLLGQRSRVVGAAAPGPGGAAPQRAGGGAGQAQRVRRAGRPRVDGPGVPRRRGPVLSAQYRLMVRTERSKARERKKYDAVELRPYTDEEIAAIEAQYAAERRRGAQTRCWEDVAVGDEVGPMVKGPLTVTDMICWHVGMGMGLYGVKPLRLGARTAEDPPVLPPRRAQRARRHAAGALGPGVRPSEWQPHHLRLRPHARDVADPPVHGLDGRRRLAVEARLRVPPVQLRGRHPVAARAR